MNPETFFQATERLLAKSPLFPGKTLDVTIIANPRAGGFTRKPRWKKHAAELEALESEASGLPSRDPAPHVRLLQTERPLHAYKMAGDLLELAESAPADVEFLIITAGGDGTSLEVQTRLAQAKPDKRERFTILRLPMGTGNDGSDGNDLVESLGRLLRPTVVYRQGAIKVSGQGTGEPRWAFNIASIGLDAYVTHMTNRLKGVMPGDSYKLWLDLAALFYDKTFKVKPMKVELSLRGRSEVEKFELPLLLLAMGESGHRSYGSHVFILPDDDNLIAVRQMSVFRKLAMKAAVAKRAHRGFKGTLFRSADRVFVQYDRDLLVQCDGETLLLKPNNFPLTMERVRDLIRILKYA
jgi:diacylglycerol kinase family enzyme